MLQGLGPTERHRHDPLRPRRRKRFRRGRNVALEIVSGNGHNSAVDWPSLLPVKASATICHLWQAALPRPATAVVCREVSLQIRDPILFYFILFYFILFFL